MAARNALSNRRAYPSLAALNNPLTRPIARRIAESDWRDTLSQIDFAFEFSDERIADIPCVRLRAGDVRSKALLLYIHSGGFVAGSARTNATAALPACHLAGCEAIAVDFSLAPEAVFPTQLIEIETVYRELISRGRDPGSIVLLGDSAGGALALSSLYRWRRLGLPMPGGLVVLSPLLDAHVASDTHIALRGQDPLLGAKGPGNCIQCFEMYAGGASLSDPEVSPLGGDLSGLPPTLIHVGTREVLLGDAARLSEKIRTAGGDVRLRVFDGMFHLFHQHWLLEDAKSAHQDIADFITRVADHG